MSFLAEQLELEAMRADALERALRVVVRHLDPIVLLTMAEEIRSQPADAMVEPETLIYAADLLCEAAADLALGPLLHRVRDD